VSAARPIKRLSKASKLLNINRAREVRRIQCEPCDPFDPLKFIEFELSKIIRNFEYCIDEHDSVFREAPSTLAYVDLSSNPVLVARESVVDRAMRGSCHERFVLAHEIAHVIRHRHSGKRLAQHQIGSDERNRANRYFELEANLFGGTLLVPPEANLEEMTVDSVRRHFGVSEKVAQFAISDAAFWRLHRKK